MEKWKKIQGKCKTYEKISIIAIGFFCVIGIFFDCNVLINKNIIITVEDIESFSLTILQIQATVGTIIFTIIALITGNMSESHMGIAISDFYLNIKPWKFTQKRLIYISLGLCFSCTVFHSLGLYNIVFYLFCSTLIIILISILEIYSAFNGKNAQRQEIEAYVNYMLENNIEYDKKLNLYQNFVSDWKEVVSTQDKENYEKYLKIFEKGVSELWAYRTDDALKAIEQQCYSMSYYLLSSEKDMLKKMGIEFVQESYNVLWDEIYDCIIEGNNILNQYECDFPLFTEISTELMRAMDELNVEDIEKRLRFDNLADLVLRVAIWLRYENKEESEQEDTEYKRYKYDYLSEINELNSFAQYLGYFLGKKSDKNNPINQAIWANVLNRWSNFSTYNIPEEREQDFLQAKVNAYFCYCYGMLMNGQENIVKRGLYLTGMKCTVRLENKYQALLYLVVHGYIYYLAVRESDDCIPRDIRESALVIWNDVKVKDAFLEFLNMLSENPEWLDLDILEQMYEVVNRFELSSQYESVKTMILEYVVSDFYLFIILFMSHEFNLSELLERNIDDMSAFRYVSIGNEERTKEMLETLFGMIFLGSRSEVQIRAEVDLMYNELEKTVKKKQKERHIRLAREAQDNYESNLNEKEICEKIKYDIIKSITEKYSPILVDADEKNEFIDINLLSLTEYTSSMGTKYSTGGYYAYMNKEFLSGIAKYLYDKNAVVYKKRFDDFADDKEFMEYLKLNELRILLGSQYILKNRDYRISAEYKRFLEDYVTIYTVALQEGIALKKNSVQVCLHDINVSIHSPDIEEVNIGYDKISGKYNYSIMNGLPIDFEEDELREFLYNNHKVINVTAKVSIQLNEKICGTLFTGKKDREKKFN